MVASIFPHSTLAIITEKKRHVCETLTTSIFAFWIVSKPSGAIQLWRGRNCSAAVTQQRETCISHVYAETIYLSGLSRYFSTVAATQNYININTTAAVCIKKYISCVTLGKLLALPINNPLEISTPLESMRIRNFPTRIDQECSRLVSIFRNNCCCENIDKLVFLGIILYARGTSD